MISDDELTKLQTIFEELDDIDGEIYQFLADHEIKNVRNALGAVRRAMDWIEKEL